MGMFDPKKRKIITAVIAVILVLAMVVPFYSAVTTEQNDEIRNTGGRL